MPVQRFSKPALSATQAPLRLNLKERKFKPNFLIKKFREDSKSSQAFAATPWLFRETTIPSRFIVIPKTSSEKRYYVPMGYVENSVLSSACLYLEGDLYRLGILTSKISMDWLKGVGGKLESRYRYSSKLVYNNFPWPKVNEKQRIEIEKLAEDIVLIREDYLDKTLAQLYDPDLMPEALLNAHQALDAAVDRLYRETPFKNSSERLEHLFARYERLISGDNKNLQEGESGWLI